MKDNPEVSVIVAAYNQERFIGRCLRSLLHQSFSHQNYEIIVIDDGSTDQTAYALSLFTDQDHSRVKVIRNESNIGLPASLNKAIKAANGKYIVRVDSDDFVNVNFINFLYIFLEENKYVDAVACDYYVVESDESTRERVNCSDKPIACGVMFRKEQILNVGLYDEKFRYQEDYDLRIRFERQYSIHRLEVPLYRYRRHDNNITNNISAMNEYYDELVKKHGLKEGN
ncbi:glycosyltransferase [Rhodobacterales bacterium FZCC0069]|nr:glycosyltransferase [Rhodobacterales bacterium FZCC0069]